MAKPNLEMRAKVKALRDKGLKTYEIAAELDISRGSVLQYERRMGLPKRKRGKPANPEIIARNQAIYEACQRGYSYERIAELFNVTKDHARMIKLREAEKRQQMNT